MTALIFGAATQTLAMTKGWEPPNKESLSPEANGDNPLGIVIEKQKGIQEGNDEYPDLGSAQVFPFEPGLGNSAF